MSPWWIDVYYGTEGGDFPPHGTHGFPPREPFNTGGGGGGEPGSGGDGVGVGAGIGLGVFGTSTSASRHYQTPYVVISNVMFATPAPQGGGVSTYTRAAVYVKGRIFLDPATAPVRSADVTISTP